MSQSEVVVLANYVAQYRLPFFERVRRDLADQGISLTVGVGGVDQDQLARADGVYLAGSRAVRSRALRLGSREMVWRHSRQVTRAADLIVMEQSRRNLDSYLYLAGRHRCPVALWGHGRTTTRPVRGWEHDVLSRLTNRADWFFAYTDGGRRAVVADGFPAGRVSVVQNSIDTAELVARCATVTSAQTEQLRADLGLLPGHTALFLGALDQSKRIGFLLAAAEQLAAELPGFTLVIAGDGPLRAAVQDVARTHPWVRYVGPLHGQDKAVMASAVEVMLNPGRVGLTAVDSFAMQVPMITTEWPGHAPEFDYLVDGVNAVVTDGGLAGFVEATLLVLGDAASLADLRAGCADSAQEYTIEKMSARFSQGVRRALAAGPRPRVAGPLVAQRASA